MLRANKIDMEEGERWAMNYICYNIRDAYAPNGFGVGIDAI